MSIEDINITIPASEVKNFKRYVQSIQTHIFNYEYAPLKEVTELLRIISLKNEIVSKRIMSEALKASKKVVFLLDKYPNYNLGWYSKYDERKENHGYDLKIFARTILFAFFHFEYEQKNCSIKDTINFFYETFLKEVSTKDPKVKKNLNYYQLSVMIGFFTLAAKHINKDYRKVTPRVCNLAVKYNLKKLMTNSKKISAVNF